MTTYPIGITGLTLTGHLVSGDTVAATFPLTESGTRAGTYYKSGALSATPTAGTYTLELRTDNTAGGLYWQGEVYTDASGAILDSTPQTGDTYAIVNHTTYGNAQLSRTAAHPANWSSLGINASGHVSRVVLVDTTTNLTNAPTSGDFTATMKTSLNASTPASITGSVGSVTAGVTLTPAERDATAGVVDARLLDAGDATDLIASIVSRIGNTNVDEASFVAAVKAQLGLSFTGNVVK
jgi:hypothetical protein